ncbi:MAG: DUF2207 domain-containing protein [Clostridiaceae bacterium]|nr:DUF2207 domain-containing protein [Clostridiaceae bacterium]
MTDRKERKRPIFSKIYPRVLAVMTALLLSLVLLPGPPLLAADQPAENYVEKADIDLVVNTDGTVDITETLAYHFHRSKRSISFDLIFPLEGEPHLVKFEFAQKTAEGEEKFIQVPQADELKSQPFSYTTVRKNDRIRVDMKMTRFSGDYLFRIAYQWNRGVVHKENQALISGPLLVVRPETRVETMRWTLTLPQSCIPADNQLIPISIDPLTMNTSPEGVISLVANQGFRKIEGIGIFLSGPASCFPLILPASETASLSSLTDRALAQNKRLSRLGSVRNQFARIVLPLTLAGLFIYFLLYLLQLSRVRRLESDFACWAATGSPALTAKLALTHPDSSNLLLGTLLHLINRKEIEWLDDIFIWKNPARNDFSSFSAWEILILQWLFSRDEDYEYVLAPERLREAARSPDFRELAQRFEKQVQQGFEDSGLIKVQLTGALRITFFVFAFLFLIMSLLLFLVSRSSTAFILLIPAAIFAFGGRTFRFLTEEGLKRYRETRHFRRLLWNPQILIESCQGQLNDLESLISILPSAIVLKKRKDYFKGIRALPEADFRKAAYALLHVYRRIPAPQSLDLDGQDLKLELFRLNREIGEMERVLAAWKEYFDSCFV